MATESDFVKEYYVGCTVDNRETALLMRKLSPDGAHIGVVGGQGAGKSSSLKVELAAVGKDPISVPSASSGHSVTPILSKFPLNEATSVHVIDIPGLEDKALKSLEVGEYRTLAATAATAGPTSEPGINHAHRTKINTVLSMLFEGRIKFSQAISWSEGCLLDKKELTPLPWPDTGSARRRVHSMVVVIPLNSLAPKPDSTTRECLLHVTGSEADGYKLPEDPGGESNDLELLLKQAWELYQAVMIAMNAPPFFLFTGLDKVKEHLPYLKGDTSVDPSTTGASRIEAFQQLIRDRLIPDRVFFADSRDPHDVEAQAVVSDVFKKALLQAERTLESMVDDLDDAERAALLA